jgi:hypothetical protein
MHDLIRAQLWLFSLFGIEEALSGPLGLFMLTFELFAFLNHSEGHHVLSQFLGIKLAFS